jgi:hypothetical protein
MEPRVFGNTFYALRGAALLAILLSCAVSLCVYFMAPAVGSNLERTLDSAMFGLCIFAIATAAILPTCLFSLRVDDTHISHLLMGKIVLSSKPLSRLQSIDIARAIGATLTFVDGTKIRFLGARLEFLRDLCDYLQERCGGRLRTDISAWASALLPLGGSPQRRPNKSLERTRGK